MGHAASACADDVERLGACCQRRKRQRAASQRKPD
jgi:hypothetical protein